MDRNRVRADPVPRAVLPRRKTVTDESQLVVRVCGLRFLHFGQDVRSRVDPRGVEAHVHCAIVTLGQIFYLVYVSLRAPADAVDEFFADVKQSSSLVVAIVSGIWHVFLWDSTQIDDGIGNAVCPSEGDDDPLFAMVERYVAATVAQQRPSIPRGDQLEFREIITPREAREGLCYAEACDTDAVRDVHDAGQFFKVGEQIERYRVVGACVVEEGRLLIERDGCSREGSEGE